MDRLLLDPRFRLSAVVTAETCERLECTLARAIAGDAVAKFGASDCRCGSHLLFRPEDPVDEVVTSFNAVGLVPVVHRESDYEKAMTTGEEDWVQRHPAMISVLYVDDEPGLVALLRHYLQETGEFEVVTAGSGTEALALLSDSGSTWSCRTTRCRA